MRMQELAQEVARRSKTAGRNMDITANHAHILIGIFSDILRETLLAEGRIEIAELGVIRLQVRKAQGGLNGTRRETDIIHRVYGHYRPTLAISAAMKKKSTGIDDA